MVRNVLIASLLAAPVILAGCSGTPDSRQEPTWEHAANNPLIAVNYRAGDALLAQAKSTLGPTQPLIAATVVSIDNLDKSSTLGRLISEQVSARFSQAGYRMIEMKFRNSVYVRRNQGELMLTREIKDIAQSHDAQAVIVGTYGESDDFIYVNLKVIQPTTNVAIAVHDYTLPMNRTLKTMIQGR